jgi:tartrate-resistant acid phosphatase type 5
MSSTKISPLLVLIIVGLMVGLLSGIALASSTTWGGIGGPNPPAQTGPGTLSPLATPGDVYLPLINRPSEITDITPVPTSEPGQVRFAVIGDYGNGGDDEARVADLVDSWNPDFVITTGDNNYPDGKSSTIDSHIGQFYSSYIGDYQGDYGSGSAANRFWPSLGNHDWHTISCSGGDCTGAYFDYFTLPGNERYYEVDLGLVHLYAVDSDSDEPDDRDQDSAQAHWLQSRLAASTSCYNLVYFHHPPYSSGRHGSSTTMRWPFSAWGADAVLNGHDHTYERLEVDGIPYFVNGAGGASLYDFENIGDLPPEATSLVRYNQDYGAMLVTATTGGITYQFYNASGSLIDEYTPPQQACPVGYSQAVPAP